jgi:cytochrome c oxidase subunit II
MTALLILICLILITIVVVQIGRVTELASSIRGEEDAQFETNKWNGLLSVIFLVLFLVGTVVSAWYYKNWMLGFGPHESASAHGSQIDFLFNLTLFFTGIVFILTHIALYWFSWKYRGRRGQRADFIAHNDKLEVIWTIIPAVVMALLVVGGLDAWNEIMADVGDDEDHIEIEATGVQFNWLIRYPGEDGMLGARDYKMITGLNPIGQDWTDVKNHDDFQPSEIVLPVGKKVRVRIIGRDVLHNFYLPHFRVKMDAVPGIPTYFVFTPVKTTQEYRQELSRYKEYQVPADPENPDGPQLWEVFNYELACAELCGSGHFSMRRLVRIVSEEEYKDWLAEQSSYYLGNIRNGDEDPLKGQAIPIEAGLKPEIEESQNDGELQPEEGDTDVSYRPGKQEPRRKAGRIPAGASSHEPGTHAYGYTALRNRQDRDARCLFQVMQRTSINYLFLIYQDYGNC